MTDERLVTAEECAAAGRREEALASLRAVVPNAASATRAALLALELGEVELAKTLAAANDEAKSAIEALLAGGDEDVAPDDPGEAVLDRLEARAPASDRIVALFLDRFGGRRDLYARQWFDERRRRGGYRPVREPLDADVVRDHLTARHTIGQYLLWPDATVSFAVIDLDLGAGALHELRAQLGVDVPAYRHATLAEYARRLLAVARSLGLRLFAEDSGSRGIHLWVFFTPRRPARAARALLGTIVHGAGPPPSEVTVEILPRQDRHGSKGLSSLVKLPLGIHRATGRRCVLLNDALEPVGDLAGLEAIAPVASDAVDAVLGHRVAALPWPPPVLDASVERAPSLSADSSPRSLSDALRALRAGAEAEEAAARMVAGCGALAALVERAFEQRTLAPDAVRAIVYSIGLCGPEPVLARRVLAAAGAPAREQERALRGHPSPIGCARLRRIVGESACEGCPGPGANAPYPTPAVFAVGACPPAPAAHAAFAEWLDTDTLRETPEQALLRSIEARLRRLEESLRERAR